MFLFIGRILVIALLINYSGYRKQKTSSSGCPKIWASLPLCSSISAKNKCPYDAAHMQNL